MSKMPLNAGPKKFPDQWSSHSIIFTPKGTRVETSGPNDPVGGRALLTVACGGGFKKHPKIQKALEAFVSIVDEEQDFSPENCVVRKRGAKQCVVVTVGAGKLAWAEGKAAHQGVKVSAFLSEFLEKAIKSEESWDEFLDLHPGTIRSTPEDD